VQATGLIGDDLHFSQSSMTQPNCRALVGVNKDHAHSTVARMVRTARQYDMGPRPVASG